MQWKKKKSSEIHAGHHMLQEQERYLAHFSCDIHSKISRHGQSVSGLENLILALVLHPEAQRKAQMELDAVIGEDRLPKFEDRAQLPYVNALCVEVQRWRPVLPLSLPHMTSQNDAYGEFFIPKGTIIMGNAWYAFVSAQTCVPSHIPSALKGQSSTARLHMAPDLRILSQSVSLSQGSSYPQRNLDLEGGGNLPSSIYSAEFLSYQLQNLPRSLHG